MSPTVRAARCLNNNRRDAFYKELCVNSGTPVAIGRELN
jgi:hypothetical protein